MSEDLEEQLKLDTTVIEILDCPNKKVCLALLQYNVDEPESWYAQIRFYAGKTVVGKFQQLSKWTINLIIWYLYNLFYILCLIKLLLFQPFEMSSEK